MVEKIVDTFWVPNTRGNAFESLVSQYGFIVSNAHPDGWANGRYFYIDVECTDVCSWRAFRMDVDLLLK